MNYSSGRMNLCQTSRGNRRPRLARFAVLLAVLALLPVVPARSEKVEQLSCRKGGRQRFRRSGGRCFESEACSALPGVLDQKANAQIAVVTIHSLEGDTVEDFANRLLQNWGVGPKGKDRGVMILLAVDDHQYWTEVGYGLEPILPDGKVGGFGREMLPLLRQNRQRATAPHCGRSLPKSRASWPRTAAWRLTPAAGVACRPESRGAG